MDYFNAGHIGLTEQIVEKEDELAALLLDEAKEILEQMRDGQLDLSASNERKAFISGFLAFD